jgi:hypothetical protein
MPIARHGRLLVFALVVHFALLLPVADMAHGTGHADEAGCEVCTGLGNLQYGLVPSPSSSAAPGPTGSLVALRPEDPQRTVPIPGTARGPPVA